MTTKHSLTLEYAQKALKINSKNGFAYSTLAETYGRIGDDKNFYKNIELALKNGFPVWEHIDEHPYDKYSLDTEFKNLITRYSTSY